MFSTSVPNSVTTLPSPRELNASEVSKNAALSSRFDTESGPERVKSRFLTTQSSEHLIHQPTPSSASCNVSRPSPLLQSRSISQMPDSSPFPISQSAANYLDGHQTRSVDGLFSSSSTSLAAPVPIHFQGEAPPRNFSSPLSRNRPSLEQVMARSSSVLKQRPTIGELSSPPPARSEGNTDKKQEEPKSESQMNDGIEMASEVDQKALEQQSFEQFNRSNQEGEDNGGDEELTPPPLMDYQFSDTSSEPETEPQSFEIDEESDKGGMLDNLLNGSVLAREEEQRRWRSRRDSSASALLSLHQGSPSTDQHEFDQPVPHPQSPSRPCSRSANNSSNPSGSNHALVSTSQFSSHRYPRPPAYPDYQRGLPITPLDGRYLPNSKLNMIERTLSDPFIPSPHVPAAPFFASPLPSLLPSYRAPAELTRHQLTHRRELSRTEPECYWHSSPSNPSTAGPLSVHSASTSPKEDLEVVIRSSSEVEEGLLSPGQSSREESTSLPAHIEGSETSSTPREASMIPNSSDIPSNAWASPSFVLPSAMGSLIQAGLLAAEREGTTKNPIPRSNQWDEDDDEQRQRVLQDEMEDPEEEPAAEEESNFQKGKDRLQPVSENKKSKKKKGGLINSTSNNNNNNITTNNHTLNDNEIAVDMSHIQECDLLPQGVPSDPRPLDKPSYSYAAMIGQSILAHPRQRLSLAEIYTWISTAYPFYKKGDPGWMNSIRHNLSLNKCFIKVEREKGGPQGKGMLWAIQPGTEQQFEGGGFRKKTLPPSGKGSKGKAGSPAGPTSKGSKSKRGLPEPEVFYEQDPGLMGPPRPPAFAPVPPGKKARLDFQNGWPTNPTSSRAHEVFVSSPSTSSPALGFGHSFESNMSSYSDHSNGLYPSHRSNSTMKEKLSKVHDQDLDDFTTPRRALSRGPSGNPSLAESNEPIGSSGQPILPPSALSGLPHLTPSISSPVSSSPGPATLPRPSLIQAHRALLKSSQRDPENVTVIEGEESTPLRIMIPAQEDLEGEGLQPGFEFDQVRLTPQDQSQSSHYQSQHQHHHQHQHEQQTYHHQQQLQSHPPPSPSPHFATSTSINHSVYSPISSLRATANDEESQEPSVWTTSMMHNPLHSSIHHNPMPAFAHMSPLQSRKASAAGGGGSGHRRGLSATGELIAHAMNPPSSSAYKTPGMQPMMSSPRRPLSKPYSFPYNHGSLSPASARKAPPPFSSTPKSASILTSSANSSNIRTPASQTTYGLTSQSPAGAAMLQHRAEMGILGFGLGFGDCGNYGDFQPGTPRLEDPYDSSRAVEDELIHLNARNTGSPASHWGGMGTPRMGLGIGGGWSFSPGIGFGDRLRNSSN